MDAPKIETRSEQTYLAVRTEVTMQTLSAAIPDAIGKVAAVLTEQDRAPGAPPFIRYRSINMAKSLIIDVGFPIDDSGNAAFPLEDTPFVFDAAPAGRYACALHKGPPSSMVAANAAFQQYAEDQGWVWDATPDGDSTVWGGRFEHQLVGPVEDPDMNNRVTQIAYRLAS